MKKLIAISLLLVISSMNSILQGHDEINRFWTFDDVANAISGAIESPTDTAKKLIRDSLPVALPQDRIVVETSTDLSDKEKKFLEKRSKKASNVLKEKFNINQPLKIAFCCSGGGNRAMIGTLGLLTAAAKSHLLDATLYISGLSGSTWTIAPFCYLASTSLQDKDYETILKTMKKGLYEMLDDYSMFQFHGVSTPPLLSFESADDFLLEVSKRFAYNQPLTLVNFFGYIVGDYALKPMGNDRISEKWTTIAKQMEEGNNPLPLCSAIFESDKWLGHSNYEWFEMSPLQAGSSSLGYIPVEFLGSGFNKGILDTHAVCHEYPISFFLGMYGSAFAATIQDISNLQKSLRRSVTLFKDIALEDLRQIQTKKSFLFQNNFIQSTIKEFITDAITSRNTLTYAHFPNYSKNLQTSILKDSVELGLFDAGIDFDLPLPTLVDRKEREMDVVFLYGSHPGNTKTLEDIANYCRKKHVGFPSVSHLSQDQLQSHAITILNDPRLTIYDKNLATYIYIPTNDIDLYSTPYITFNFKYNNDEINYLSDKVENALLSNMNEIKQVMSLVAQKRYAQ